MTQYAIHEPKVYYLKGFTAIVNGLVITPFRIFRGDIFVKDGKIAEFIEPGEAKVPSGMDVVDVGGAYVSPGFIDIHLHGGGGADTMDATTEAIEKITSTHSRGGTTSVVLSTVTAPEKDTIKAIEAVSRAKEGSYAGAEILGVHLEGPYISPRERGAHNPKYIRTPSHREIEKILEYTSSIIRVTAAPEIDGALQLGLKLKNAGILPCIGHSDATIHDVVKAIEAGYTHVTHLYSSTSTVKARGYKVAGVVEASLLFNDLTVEIIGDGKHLPPELIKLVLKVKGLNKVCAVTDAMRATGLPPGRYKLGEIDAIVEDDVAWTPDKTKFCGSVASMDVVLDTLIENVGLKIQDAIRLITINPARIIGVDERKGSLTVGKDADITIFNENHEILLTMVRGQVIYESKKLHEAH